MTSHARIRGRSLAVASIAAVACAMMWPGAASAAGTSGDPTPAPAVSPAAHGTLSAGKLAGGLERMTGRHAVFVQLSGSGAADAADEAKAKGQSKSAQKAHANAAKKAARTKSAAVVDEAKKKDRSATELWQVGNALPGVAINADAAAIRAIADRGDVVKITPLVPKHTDNANATDLTDAVATWQQTHNTGKGVKIAVIDTGLDYTHADFGGAGTKAAWDAARADSTNEDWYSTLTDLAKVKVGGGYDFSGDDYDADPRSADYQPVAHPDADPIGCGPHGTHVAGISAGFGENADGTTFTGDYSTLTADDIAKMKAVPGTAPEATVYPFKVFGCEGSTDVVIPALDRSLDLDGDGSMVKADIVNLSLGSDYAVVDDPENDVVDKLAEEGVLPVIAMGNNGDLTDTGGSPGNAVRALAVASSVDSFQQLDGLRVNAPSELAGTVAGQFSIAYPWADSAPVTGDVVAVSAANADGCSAFSDADAAAVAGKIAWLTWDSDDATRRCGSAGRSANARAAGAIGAIFTGDVNPFTAGITGDAQIPVFQLTQPATAKLQPALAAGTLNVTFDGSLALSVSAEDSGINDLISSFSSRGTHGSLGVVKPDVSAPGDTILSAGLGTGDGVINMSGTSMATPHTAGIAALVMAAHPTWTTEQVKADIMNTAGHDTYAGVGGTGDIYSPARDGAGRVDALAAVENTLLVYSADVAGGVSASFGPVEAPATQPTVTKTRTLTVQNTGDAAVSATLSYSASNTQPGVAYTVSPSTVKVAAGASTTVKVTMTITTAKLRNTIDPTMDVLQSGVPRQFVADASGRLMIAVDGSSAAPLRVPVYGAAKPISQTTTTDAHMGDQRALVTRGTGVSQGSGSTAYQSLLSVATLGATSPQLPACTATMTANCTVNQTATAGDLQYVGAGSAPAPGGGYADGWLWFSIATYGDWATVGNSTVPYVDIDTTGDGKPDFEVFVQNLDGTDLLLAQLVDLKSNKIIDLEPVNFQFGDVNTNVFDTNVLNIPVWPALLGVTEKTKSFPITYTVGMNSYYAVNANGDIDGVGPISYDVVKPAIAVDSALYADEGGTGIPYTRGTLGNGNGKGNAKGHDVQALVLHLHGAAGHRAEVVKIGG
ncbi:S8 family peptidase [Microbacterium terrisoli]|uniref:S8 family peptidase n=1 Tax=Microbacterium terrisoli TaxID=3242192 RepID=UPI00280437AD|nr:S8 family serine peptidase [Microbacterium protaetiae]